MPGRANFIRGLVGGRGDTSRVEDGNRKRGREGEAMAECNEMGTEEFVSCTCARLAQGSAPPVCPSPPVLPRKAMH